MYRAPLHLCFSLGCVCSMWKKISDRLLLSSFGRLMTTSDFLLLKFNELTTITTITLTTSHSLADETLRQITSLTALTLHCRRNTDIVSHLPALVSLTLFWTDGWTKNIQDFTNLTKLTLQTSSNNSQLISNLTNLTHLSILGTDICKYEHIAPLTNLVALHVPLSGKPQTKTLNELLPNITALNLIHSKQIDDDLISTLINLAHLDISYITTISDKSISSLTNLTYLNIKHTQEITGSSLLMLTKLQILQTFGENTVTKFKNAYLHQVTSLTSLHWDPSQEINYELFPRLKYAVCNNSKVAGITKMRETEWIQKFNLFCPFYINTKMQTS